MAVVINPYAQQGAQLGVIEAGLKTLKHEKVLLGNSDFSDMYWAVERHHRDLRLAHLTGKAKDLMEQATKDTKFYNILIKMLCEIKRLPSGKQKQETLTKVHNWYLGNRHTLATGPKFGKTNKSNEPELKRGFMMSRTPTAKNRSIHTKSATSMSSRNSKKDKENRNRKDVNGFKQFISDTRDDTTRDDFSSLHGGIGDTISMNPPSEPASSRLSTFGNDFMTNRFMMDLPSSKLSWHLESPMGKASTDWDGTEFDRIGESTFSNPFDYHASHPSVPNSSPRSHLDDDSPRSVNSGASSGVDVGSTDMMDFHSDVRRRLSRGPTSGGSGGVQMSEDVSSSAGYGLQKRMVHSIASLVNPHAKLAETEAKRAEQEYIREKTSITSFKGVTSRAQTSVGSRGPPPDLSAHIPVLRAVSVSSPKGDNISAFNSFRNDHLYGQDILSRHKVVKVKLQARATLVMPPISKGKLKFVGRSGTALDVRYSSHAQADMPERHTKDLIHLYNVIKDSPKPAVVQAESPIHTQSLEEFYQTADTYYPIQKNRSSRIQSAPAPRVKSSKMSTLRNAAGAKTAQPQRGKSPHKQHAGTTPKQAKQVRLAQDELADEILYSTVPRNSPVKIETVVNLIDHVKDEMNFFKEKLAPTPMAGFRQPASTSVSSKPLSRPGSTASRASRPKSAQPRPRSPSPQGRPGTPTMDPENILMGNADVPADGNRHMSLPNRPHSATVNKAVDWRGKVTPEATKIKSKMRFGGHSYVQKLKPSLRTAGATSAGNRPKTAPVPVKDKWANKEKECDNISLPDVQIRNYPNIVTHHPSYPVKRHDSKPLVLITITECDQNERVPQAASNTMTQVDDQDMDRIMSIQHLLGSSDSRYGSMGSLFLDEDFLRSFNSRYTARSSMSHMTTDSQNREFLSFVAPTPRVSPAESRTVIRPTRKPDVKQIDEDSILLEEEQESCVFCEADDPPIDLPPQEQEQAGLTNGDYQPIDTDVKVIEDTQADQVKDTEIQSSEVKVTQGQSSNVTFPVRDIVHVCTEDKDNGVHIEVTALPASGLPPTPPSNTALQGLSTSDTWHFKPGKDQNVEVTTYPSGTQELDFNHQVHQHHYQHQPKKRRPYSAFDSRLQGGPGHWAKSIIKPDNYCFQCIPETMTTKVGRSAGRMPGGNQTAAGQVLRMSRRQNEYFKKAPPVRTPPSIPSGHSVIAKQSPRQGQQYCIELEHHARKVNSPRHFMEQVVELRKENCKSAPPGSNLDAGDIMGSMSVISLRVPNRAQTAPSSQQYRYSESGLQLLPTHDEVTEDSDPQVTTPSSAPARVTARSKPTITMSPPQSIAHTGRPIPQVSHIPDPIEENEAVLKQREAKAAVDIQRIFRGFVCRNSYRKLLWENRKELEDKQQTAMENQKEYRKHQVRKAKILNRPPLDPELLQWASDFKAIQTKHEERRQEKGDFTAKEMLANQQKAKSKIEVIGPHVEIYDIYHPKETGPSKRDMHKAAVRMQKHVRGFLVRKRFEKLRRKATFCGSTWEKLVKEYKQLLVRVQRWHGVDKPTTPFSLQHMHDYMDMRRRYESQFDKKSFGSELELSELDPFFRECDLYPSKSEIEDGLDVITQGRALRKGTGLKKADALNLLFYIYVPPGTGLTDTRRSTWMNPIINGVEAKKMIGSELVEGAPLKPCADLVIKSRRERKEKEDAEIERLKELERKKNRKEGEESDSDDEEEERKKKKPVKVVKQKNIFEQRVE